MTRQLNRLTAIQIKNAKQKGLYHDGGGLYLRVKESGTKSWLFCYRVGGRDREMGLGSENTVSLAEARIKAQEARKLLADKIDPLKARQEAEAKVRLEASKSFTFKECATQFIETNKSGWRSEKTLKEWPRFFEIYVYPVIGDIAIKHVNLDLVLKIIEPIWTTKTETADRLRSRMERVLDWARVRGYREGENPARWRGHLENLLVRPSKLNKVVHHPSLPYAEAADFVALLKEQPGMDAKVLEFTILTAVRTNEATKARWDEIDLKNRIWTLSADRTKTGKEHRVPLSEATLDVLQRVAKMSGHADLATANGWLFPSSKRGKPISNMAMLMLLRRIERTDITVHGFRSTFRVWAAERTTFPREVAEAALAHVVENQVEAAYQRSDLFEKRKRLMDAWAKYCSAPTLVENADNIVLLKSAQI
jgi:integrase